MKKFPASIPRRQFWSHSVGKTHCPMCNGELEQEYHAYFMLVQEGYGMAEFSTGLDGGYFCPACPVVVLDTVRFSDIAKIAVPRQDDETAFTVIGLVDLDAVPEDKRNMPFDDDDNPMPVVEFINVTRSNPKERAKQRAKKRRRLKKNKNR